LFVLSVEVSKILTLYSGMRLTTRMHRIQKGFTLIELLITLVIAAILVTIAIPNFSGLIQNNRLISQTNSLIADLNYARSESIKRGTPVSVSAEDGEWANGWVIKLQSAADTDFLRQSAAVQKGLSIKTDDSIDTIAFLASGNVVIDADEETQPKLTLCDARGDDFARVIGIEVTGRITILSNEGENCA